jgi:alpha-tubulin suppressor-like RCC1 family protein
MDGTVWCWGTNQVGQLGSGGPMPTPVTPPATQTYPAGPEDRAVQVITTQDQPLTGAAEVVCGGAGNISINQSRFCCARMRSGAVQCWGSNAGGELGDGTTTARSRAAPVSGLGGVSELQAGADHVCAKTTNNQVVCWGRNGDGQVFDNSQTNRNKPVMVAVTSSFSAGRFYTCIVGPDSSISCAGWNSHNRFGIGTGTHYDGDDYPSPVQTLTMLGGSVFTGVEEVAAGGVTCAKMKDKTLYCWGDDAYGTTGTGTPSTVPRQVIFEDGTPLTNIKRVFGRYQKACAETNDGMLYCWGRGDSGEMGDGTFENRGYPMPYSLTCP